MKKLVFTLFVLFVSVLGAFGNVSGLGIDWEMSPCFGLDDNFNGKIDVVNDYNYVNKNSYETRVFLSGDGAKVQQLYIEGASYTWTVSNKSFSKTFNSYKPELVTNLPEGSFNVSCKISSKSLKGLVKGKVVVNNILIACMGDSYASGEGAPEQIYERQNASVWADGGYNLKENIPHLMGHRSTLAWGPQAALFLENYDKHTSVTFVFTAVSGACIDRGFLEPDRGVDHPFEIGKLTPQVEMLENIVGDRPIDQLWISIGGNDLSLVNAATMLVLFEKKKNKEDPDYDKKMEYIVEATQTGKWSTDLAFVEFMEYDKDVRPGLNNLKDAYKRFDKKLKEKVSVKDIYILGYPSPVKPGTVALQNMFPGLKVDELETKILIENTIEPIKGVQKEACKELGWNYVDVNTIGFDNHTYEKKLPNNPADYKGNQWIKEKIFPTSWEYFKKNILPRNVRWFRTEEESVIMEGASPDGEKPTVFSTCGTLHPNEFGYQAYMHELLSQIKIPSGYPDYKYIYKDKK